MPTPLQFAPDAVRVGERTVVDQTKIFARGKGVRVGG